MAQSYYFVEDIQDRFISTKSNISRVDSVLNKEWLVAT